MAPPQIGGPILEPALALGMVTIMGAGDVAGATGAVDTEKTVAVAGASGPLKPKGTVIAGASGAVDTDGTVIAGASGAVDTDGTVAVAGAYGAGDTDGAVTGTVGIHGSH